jgi:hypothetical protein
VNTLRLFLVLGTASAIAAAAGCDTNAKCVADCDEGDDGVGSESGSESGSGSGSESGSSGGACEDANAEAQAFIEANRACVTHSDCKFADGICYQGEEQQCGSIALANSADDAQWDAIHATLASECECGANPCGATAVCTAEGICEAQFGTMEAECAFAEQEVELFLADNRACEVDEDCQWVEKGCYDGPLADCTAISLNVDADLDVWDQLQAALGPSGHECGGNDCGPQIVCSAEGLCEAPFL